MNVPKRHLRLAACGLGAVAALAAGGCCGGSSAKVGDCVDSSKKVGERAPLGTLEIN